MFRRPSFRRRGKATEVGINLIPMLDTLVTLIAFILYSMSFLAVVSIDSPVPVNSAKNFQANVERRPLQLTVTLGDQETLIWSPFERIRRTPVPNLPEGGPDVLGVHTELVKIKQQFPKERQVVIVPRSGTSYDALILVMDAIRAMDPTDPAVYVKNETTGVDQEERTLFPDVVFGNLLGDS